MDPITTQEAINALKGVSVEFYKDLAQPSVKRVGHAFDVIFKVGLSPLSALDFGFEEAKAWLEKRVRDRLSNTPSEFIASPPNNVVFPAIKNIAMSNDSPELREIYAELLFKALDTRTAMQVHPSFVFVLEQLSPQEALALFGLKEEDDAIFADSFRSYAVEQAPTIEVKFKEHCASIGLQTLELSQLWLENLCRLGMLQVRTHQDAEYHPSEELRWGQNAPTVAAIEYRRLRFTDFGRAFVVACTPPSSEKNA